MDADVAAGLNDAEADGLGGYVGKASAGGVDETGEVAGHLLRVGWYCCVLVSWARPYVAETARGEDGGGFGGDATCLCEEMSVT